MRWRSVRAESIPSRIASSSAACSASSRRLGREARPLLRLERDLAAPPRAAPDLHGRLEQRELVRPGREPAPALEVVQPPEHRDGRVARRFLGDLGELAAAEVGEGRPAPRDLEPRCAQEQLAQPRHGLGVVVAQRVEPGLRLGVQQHQRSSSLVGVVPAPVLTCSVRNGEARRPRLAAVHRLGVAPGDRRARRPARLRLALDVGSPLPDRRRPGGADLRGLPDARRLGRAHREDDARADGRRQHVPQPGARREDDHHARPHERRPDVAGDRRRLVRDRAHRAMGSSSARAPASGSTGSTRRSS